MVVGHDVGMAQVTLRDVAQAAGVSMATASRVLNGSARRPSEQISQRVRVAARQLGYVPNASAQALARSTSGLMGLVIQDLENPYFSAIASGFQRAAAAEGRLVLLSQTGGEEAATSAALRGMGAQRVDGVLVVGALNLDLSQQSGIRGLLSEISARGGGVVTVGQDHGVGTVLGPDDRAGGVSLAKAAVTAGYRRFAIVDDTARAPSAVARSEGFVAGLRAAGLSVEHSVRGAVAVNSGGDIGTALVRYLHSHGGGGPLCFFAITDAIAVAVLGRAQQAGVRVPEDLGIMGFDGIRAGRDCCPSLTTVDLPLPEMGRRAFTLLRHSGDVEDEEMVPVGWRVDGRSITVPGRFRRGGTTLR
ncbi:LacI family transcriptional regulator [Acidipropionibacterium jensenii]|uniref:LacI family transcriptional regulator n=2 Tax=Acidipropionibacterium jensenii TaxID=1749 RepID=A0A3T0S1R0_9ACTN|nr:LacI family transcriptional regulator [Acidipropionibacterium jensenii]